MNYTYNVLLAMLLLAQAACGQGRDSVLAVHHLFAQKRGSGQGLTGLGAAMVYGASPEQRAQNAELAKSRQGTPLGVAPLVAGWLKQGQFSAEREGDIIGRYQQGELLPADVRRKLRRRHFHRSAHDLAQGW